MQLADSFHVQLTPSCIKRAARRPISTAKFVPRSQGYTWLMLAKYSPGMGVWMAGMFFEWLTSGTGWA